MSISKLLKQYFHHDSAMFSTLLTVSTVLALNRAWHSIWHNFWHQGFLCVCTCHHIYVKPILSQSLIVNNTLLWLYFLTSCIKALPELMSENSQLASHSSSPPLVNFVSRVNNSLKKLWQLYETWSLTLLCNTLCWGSFVCCVNLRLQDLRIDCWTLACLIRKASKFMLS